MVKVPTIAEAFAIARKADPSDRELALASDVLVSWGNLDLADRLLGRLEGKPEFLGHVARLRAISRQLRRSGVLDELTAMNREGIAIDGSYEAFTARNPEGSDKVIVVFTGIDPRFSLSLMLLHLFLKRLKAHVIYLTDMRQLIFLDGLETVARGYEGLLAALRSAIDALRVGEVHVMANSAGGFAGLRYAIDLGARTFLGTGIRTDLSPDSPLPVGQFFKEERLRRAAPELMVDLKPLLAKSTRPDRVMLYCGADHVIDRSHAMHLADLPNVEVTMLGNYELHDVVAGLLARGQFESVLERFMKPGPVNKNIEVL